MATGMLEMIFPKKNLKYEFLNNLYFGPKLIFYGHLLGFLASFCFVVFCRWSTMVPNIFTQLSPPRTPHHETVSNGPSYRKFKELWYKRLTFFVKYFCTQENVEKVGKVRVK